MLFEQVLGVLQACSRCSMISNINVKILMKYLVTHFFQGTGSHKEKFCPIDKGSNSVSPIITIIYYKL